MDEELITVDDGDSEPYDPGPPDPEVHSDVESYDLTEIEVPNADNTGYIKLALRDQFSKDHVNDGDNPDCQGEDVGFYKFAVSSKGHAGLLQSVKSSDIEELGFYTSDKVDELLDKGLPEVTEEDEGKTLQVKDGEWTKDKQIIEVTKAEYDALGDTVKTDGKLYFIKDWTQPYAMNGKGMVSKVLWSGKQQTTGTITLNDSADNYDLLLIRVGQDDTNNWNIIIPKYSSYNNTNDAEIHGIISGYDRWIKYLFVNNTTINVSSVGAINVNISKIIGLRFCAATCCYSTDEQIVGQWIDGKPIYQKTVELDNVIEIKSNSWTTISNNDFNGDKLIKIDLYNNDGVIGSWIGGQLSNTILDAFNIRSTPFVLKIYTIQYTKSTD